MSVCAAALCAGTAHASTLSVIALDPDAAPLVDPVRQAAVRVSAATVRSGAATAEDTRAASDIGLVCAAGADECLVKLALFVHVDELLAVSARPGPAGLELELVLVDAQLGRRTGAAMAIIPDGTPAHAPVAQAVEELFVPERVLGTVIVAARPADTEIVVDGTVHGTASPPLELTLRKGSHTMTARAPGHVTQERVIDVAAGRTVHVDLTLTRADPRGDGADRVADAHDPDAPSPRVVVGIIGAAAGGAALLGGGVTAIVVDTTLRTTSTGDARSRQDLLVVERTAAVVAVLGGAVALAGAGLVFLGSGDDEAP